MNSMTTIYKVKWAGLKPDDEVYIYGTHLGEPMAYGPHYVVSIETRTLKTTLRHSSFRSFRVFAPCWRSTSASSR